MQGKELLKLVEKGTWKGMPQWRCTLCPFDSVQSKDDVVEHILAVHFPPPPPPVQGTPLLVDRYGNPLIVAVPGVEARVETPVDDTQDAEEGTGGEDIADADLD